MGLRLRLFFVGLIWDKKWSQTRRRKRWSPSVVVVVSGAAVVLLLLPQLLRGLLFLPLDVVVVV